jgi:hypothetical protein
MISSFRWGDSFSMTGKPDLSPSASQVLELQAFRIAETMGVSMFMLPGCSGLGVLMVPDLES